MGEVVGAELTRRDVEGPVAADEYLGFGVSELRGDGASVSRETLDAGHQRCGRPYPLGLGLHAHLLYLPLLRPGIKRPVGAARSASSPRGRRRCRRAAPRPAVPELIICRLNVLGPLACGAHLPLEVVEVEVLAEPLLESPFDGPVGRYVHLGQRVQGRPHEVRVSGLLDLPDQGPDLLACLLGKPFQPNHSAIFVRMFRVAREHLTEGREITEEQRRYLETSGKMERGKAKLARSKSATPRGEARSRMASMKAVAYARVSTDEQAVREYETVPNPRTEENPSGLYTLTPRRIRRLPEEEVEAKRLAAEDAGGARFRELYALLDLRVAVQESGDLDVTVGTTNTKEVMPWNRPGSPSTTSTPT